MSPASTTNPGARPARTDPGAGLPDRRAAVAPGYGEDEPTQRAPRPPLASNSEPDTLFSLRPARAASDGADLDGGPTDEGIAITAPSPPSPGPDARSTFVTDPSASARPLPSAGGRGRMYIAAGVVLGIVVVTTLVVALSGDNRGGVLAIRADAGIAAPDDDNEAPPRAAERAKLLVESEPPGVNILLDEERIVGKTPVEFEHAPGTVKLQAQFKDQPPIDLEVEVAPGEKRTVRMLAKVPLIVKSSPPRAKVKVNGETVGETPFDRKAVVDPEKAVSIKLELGGYEFAEKIVEPKAGEPLNLGEIVGQKKGGPPPVVKERDVVQKFGLLNMRSAPWVQVKVKGQVLGNTTFTQIKVAAGRQTLVMTNPEVGINETLTVTIPEDKTLNVSLEWEKKGNDWRIKSKSIK